MKLGALSRLPFGFNEVIGFAWHILTWLKETALLNNQGCPSMPSSERVQCMCVVYIINHIVTTILSFDYFTEVSEDVSVFCFLQRQKHRKM